jgi:hypothetical protein
VAKTVDPLEEVYIDETSQSGPRFLVIGGIVLPRRLSNQFENAIIEARRPRLTVHFTKDKTALASGQLTHKLSEIGWNEISTGDFRHYKKVVDAFFDFPRAHLGNTGLEHFRFYCSVVDTHVKGRRYTGKTGQLGFNREIYFHCMSVARNHRQKIFHVYPDDRTTNMTMEQMRKILNRGFRKEDKLRPAPFRRVQFRISHESQAIQVSDILIGAVAYRLNRLYEKPGGADKTALCEYILRKGKFWDHVHETSFRPRHFGQFQVWFRRHKN